MKAQHSAPLRSSSRVGMAKGSNSLRDVVGSSGLHNSTPTGCRPGAPPEDLRHDLRLELVGKLGGSCRRGNIHGVRRQKREHPLAENQNLICRGIKMDNSGQRLRLMLRPGLEAVSVQKELGPFGRQVLSTPPLEVEYQFLNSRNQRGPQALHPTHKCRKPPEAQTSPSATKERIAGGSGPAVEQSFQCRRRL